MYVYSPCTTPNNNNNNNKKDNIDVCGMPTTAACPQFSHMPIKSATCIELLDTAGAVCLGKTNMDQFALGLVGVRSPHGACSCVFNDAYISGGSSSGSAVRCFYCPFLLLSGKRVQKLTSISRRCTRLRLRWAWCRFRWERTPLALGGFLLASTILLGTNLHAASFPLLACFLHVSRWTVSAFLLLVVQMPTRSVP